MLLLESKASGIVDKMQPRNGYAVVERLLLAPRLSFRTQLREFKVVATERSDIAQISFAIHLLCYINLRSVLDTRILASGLALASCCVPWKLAFLIGYRTPYICFRSAARKMKNS